MYQRYIERSRNAASQSLLNQLATAEVATQTEGSGAYIDVIAGAFDAPIQRLADSGFRPDRNVAWYVKGVAGANGRGGFCAFAIHVASGSTLYVYDNVNASGVEAFDTGRTYSETFSDADLDVYTINVAAGVYTVSDNGAPPTIGTVGTTMKATANGTPAT
jgi:hypothetical protein